MLIWVLSWVRSSVQDSFDSSAWHIGIFTAQLSGFLCRYPHHVKATHSTNSPRSFMPLPFAHSRNSWNVPQMSFPLFCWQNQTNFSRPYSKGMSTMIPPNPLFSHRDSASLPLCSLTSCVPKYMFTYQSLPLVL